MNMNTQEKIIELIERIKENRRVKKSINESIRAECSQSNKYRQHADEVSKRKQEMKQIELSVASPNDLQQIDRLKAEIKNDQQVLSDIALNAYTKGETISVDLGEGQQYNPIIKVTFQMQLL